MKIFRGIAAAVLLIYGFVPIALLLFAMNRLPEKVARQLAAKGAPPMWELYAALAGVLLFFGFAAWQLWRGKGRGIVTTAAILTAPAAIASWKTIPLALPLLYIIAEAVLPYVQKKKPDQQKPGDSAKTATPQEGDRPHASRSKDELIGWLTAIPILIGVALLYRHMPGIITPKNAQSGFFVFLVYMWFIVLIHELGHAITGALLGFEWMAFAVSPIEIQRIGGKTIFKWNPNSGGGHYCGFPKSPDNLWRRHLTMVAGGPAANILTFFALWAVLWLAQGRIDGYAFGFLRGMMIWSLVTALGNLVPVKVANFKTDGRFIWDAFFAPSESRRALAIYSCMISRNSPLRPRDWRPEWVKALREGESDLATAALVSAWAQDRLLADPADFEALDALLTSTQDLERLATQLPANDATAITFQVDWLRCRYDGIVEQRTAKTLAAARKDKTMDPYELLRMEAALKLAEGATTEAEQLLDKAEKDIQKRQSGFRQLDLDDLRAYRDAALRA